MDEDFKKNIQTMMMILKAIDQMERNEIRGKEDKNEEILFLVYETLDKLEDEDKNSILLTLSKYFIEMLNGVANNSNSRTSDLLKELEAGALTVFDE